MRTHKGGAPCAHPTCILFLSVPTALSSFDCRRQPALPPAACMALSTSLSSACCSAHCLPGLSHCTSPPSSVTLASCLREGRQCRALHPHEQQATGTRSEGKRFSGAQFTAKSRRVAAEARRQQRPCPPTAVAVGSEYEQAQQHWGHPKCNLRWAGGQVAIRLTEHRLAPVCKRASKWAGWKGGSTPQRRGVSMQGRHGQLGLSLPASRSACSRKALGHLVVARHVGNVTQHLFGRAGEWRAVLRPQHPLS